MAQARSKAKIIVIDDDPTGSQTVHGCPLLLRWDPQTLAAGLRHPSPLLFLLANTRALAPAAAQRRLRGICRALRLALAQAEAAGVVQHWLVVSRGDSTLRGHFPLEMEVLNAELGPFDATLLVPAFLEGGRTTVDGVHLLHGQPVHESAFARDRLFGYESSYLPAWVEEKSGGCIPAERVERISLEELDAAGIAPEAGAGGEGRLLQRLGGLAGNTLVVVDAEQPRQLAALGSALWALTAPQGAGGGGRPRRFLLQSAASLLNGLAQLPPQPLGPGELAALRRRQGPAGGIGGPLPGLVLVGSHVPLADAQLQRLLAEPSCAGVELNVARLHRILEGPLPDRLLASLEAEWLEQLLGVLDAGSTAVLFSSRGELVCRHAAERRALGLAVAGAMARLAAALVPRLGYLISKGGITTHTLLADGMDLAAVELQGQLLPGLSLVLAPVGGGGSLPVLTFPGNLGDADTLLEAWRWMDGGMACDPAGATASG